MEMTDSRSIAASPDVVWAALLDAEVLKACVPGCEEMSGTPEDGYAASVVQKVGPVKARFHGTVTLSDIVPGTGVTITGEGKGGAAGFARGSANVTLAAQGEGTLLVYDVQAAVGGKLAQLGSRLIDGVARKMADQFFERFAEVVEGPKEDIADVQAPEATTGGTGEQQVDAPKKGWVSRLFGRKSEGEEA